MNKNLQDNLVRVGFYTGDVDKKRGEFIFILDLLEEEVVAKVRCRLRGVAPARASNNKKDTYDVVAGKLADEENVIVKLRPRPHSTMPFLVDVFLEDGTHLNEWLVANGFAYKYEQKGDTDESC
jgi:hypothetical protein